MSLPVLSLPVTRNLKGAPSAAGLGAGLSVDDELDLPLGDDAGVDGEDAEE